MTEDQQSPGAILRTIYEKAAESRQGSIISDSTIRDNIDYICRCINNRSGVRLLMACLLGKIHNPKVDPRKPYTEIGGNDSFSGRNYDEKFLSSFINNHHLPVNVTTAFLTSTLRNINKTLTTDCELIGRPRELYKKTLQVLEDVAEKRIATETVFVELVRVLLQIRDEKRTRMASLLAALKPARGVLPLSSEAIVTLIRQHLSCKNSSRLPVLIVTAAYEAAGIQLGESILPLNSHNAADSQTGSIGDVEICLVGDDAVVTAYEMKMKRVLVEDIDAAIAKMSGLPRQIDNYIFVTTEKIDQEVVEYSSRFYEKTEGTEIAILDCISFLKHFLHFFHRIRVDFLNAYQNLVLMESDSSVSQPLKEAFLALRQAAESEA